jgi:hypothetical protein
LADGFDFRKITKKVPGKCIDLATPKPKGKDKELIIKTN